MLSNPRACILVLVPEVTAVYFPLGRWMPAVDSYPLYAPYLCDNPYPRTVSSSACGPFPKR